MFRVLGEIFAVCGVWGTFVWYLNHLDVKEAVDSPVAGQHSHQMAAARLSSHLHRGVTRVLHVDRNSTWASPSPQTFNTQSALLLLQASQTASHDAEKAEVVY